MSILNWFKKQLNKLFDSEIDDENYYEDINEETENSHLYINEDSNRDQQNIAKRSSFRFPLIADDELDLSKPAQPPSDFGKNEFSNDRYVEDSIYRPKNFYQPNAISKVYEVEVSGIRELLEKRQRIKGYSNVLNHSPTKIRKVEKLRQEEIVKKEIIKRHRHTIEVNEENSPQMNKRRFIPTDVPSPVYGYKKPSNINELLVKKQDQDQQQMLKQFKENDPSIEAVIRNDDNATSMVQNVQRIDEVLNFAETNEPVKEITSPLEPVQSAEEVQSIQSVKENTSFVKDIQLAEKVTSTVVSTEALEELASVVEPIQVDKETVRRDEPIEAIEEMASTVETNETFEDSSADEIVQAVDESSVRTIQLAEENVGQVEPIEETEEIASTVENIQIAEEVSSSFETIETFKEASAVETTQVAEEMASTIETIEENSNIAEPIETAEAFANSAEQINMHNGNQEDLEDKNETFKQQLNDSFIDIDEEVKHNIAATHEEFYEKVEENQRVVNEIGENSQYEDIEETSNNVESFNSDLKNLAEEKEQQISNEEQHENTEKNEQPKGSKLPFNVLMLKSDKEKYAAKLAQKELRQHNDDIKDISRHQTYGFSEKVIEQPREVYNQEILNDSSDTNINTTDIEQKEQIEIMQEKEDDKPETIVTESIEKAVTKIYKKPSLEFLVPPEEKTEDREWMESQADILVEALSYFQVTAQVESIMQGPAVTQFEITVGHGTKVSKIRNLSDDLKLALAAKDIRIQAPIPGKSSIGIEIPNRISRAVRLSEVTSSESFKESDSPLEAALGLDLTGKPVTLDLRKMPHGLIAGATGSGKSVCINSILVSLLYKADPHELKLMLIDPKMVELAPFNHIPHLVSPVITDVKAATAALKWAVEEMERRYQLFAHAGVRDLPRFNKLAEQNGEYGHKLPYILIVIDELADLMMMSPADVEEAICRIAQKARACGIHLIVATQRPSVDVITGLIKSNIPTRIAFAVSSQVDSRTILDSQGAERLLGRGDMLYLGNGMSDPIRLQGTFVTDDEIEEIIEHVREQGEPDYFFEQEELLKKTEMVEETDELFEDVCRFVYEQGTASTSSIQRKYHIGYNRAARLIDLLENHGFISEQRGSKPREVFITDSDLSSMFD